MGAAPRWVLLLFALFILGFFFHFTADAGYASFRSDEMMNIYGYWQPGAWDTAWANIEFWSKFYRPMGGIYYLTLFTMFGLDPLPFDAVRLAILALNALVFYWLATRIAGSREVAALATLPVAYHAGIGNIAYHGSMIYDVLCGGFFFLALLYYIRKRQMDAGLGFRQTCVFLALYVCALNSKEMAVSLPVIVAAYELLYGMTLGLKRAIAGAGPLLAAIAITVIFIAGKTLGAGSLAQMEAYRPVFTWARFFDSSVGFLNAIFYTDRFTAAGAVLVWALLLGIAIFSRDRRLMLLWIWVIVSPLPIAFLRSRDGGSLYIVMAGWALVAGILVEMLARRTAVVSRAFPLVLYAAAVIAYSHETARRHAGIEGGLRESDGTGRLIQQFRALPTTPVRGSSVVILNDPFPGAYATYFVAALSWKDRSLLLWLQNQAHLNEGELAAMNYVFDFPDGNLRQVRP